MNVIEVNTRITEKADETIRMIHNEFYPLSKEERIQNALTDIKFLGYYIADRINVGKKYCGYGFEEISEINDHSDREIFRIYSEMQKI